MFRYTILILGFALTGCSLLPDIAHQPTLHNPFPQLSKVGVAPFFNLSAEPTVDSRQFSLAYFNELQTVPGFEVVPPGVVERAMQDHEINLRGPEDARRLAQLLGVDALVIGAVTDFSPFYPPRCGLQVEWYAANPCFHPIPPGYGLPWATPEEEHIPAPLVFEAEMALAKAQLATQTPSYTPLASEDAGGGAKAEETGPPGGPSDLVVPGDMTDVSGPGLPGNWPDPRGFVPPPPSSHPPDCRPSTVPVLQHTQIYNGNDMEFTEALSSYYYFRDDARFGGWQGYLERSDDFIRFCCHMHIAEMLSARGGAGQTRVVWRWPTIR